MTCINDQTVRSLFTPLACDTHKYRRGVCDIIAGSSVYVGAAVLATRAANRAGAGYINVYTCEEVAHALHCVQPSVVVRDTLACLSRDLTSTHKHPHAVLIGCGLLATHDTEQLIVQLCLQTRAPLVLDGTALALMTAPEVLESVKNRARLGYETVITPHHGEALTLAKALGWACSELSACFTHDKTVHNPSLLAYVLSKQLGATCVLKGPDTFLAYPDTMQSTQVDEMHMGSPVLAKAGTGDVLAGLIVGYLCQGNTVRHACAKATVVHACAAISALEKHGCYCVCTEDIVDCIPDAVKMITQQ